MDIPTDNKVVCSSKDSVQSRWRPSHKCSGVIQTRQITPFDIEIQVCHVMKLVDYHWCVHVTLKNVITLEKAFETQWNVKQELKRMQNRFGK